MAYREYETPIHVIFKTLVGFASGRALGVREVQRQDGRSDFFYLVATDREPALVRAKDVLPKAT